MITFTITPLVPSPRLCLVHELKQGRLSIVPLRDAARAAARLGQAYERAGQTGLGLSDLPRVPTVQATGDRWAALGAYERQV